MWVRIVEWVGVDVGGEIWFELTEGATFGFIVLKTGTGVFIISRGIRGVSESVSVVESVDQIGYTDDYSDSESEWLDGVEISVFLIELRDLFELEEDIEADDVTNLEYDS